MNGLKNGLQEGLTSGLNNGLAEGLTNGLTNGLFVNEYPFDIDANKFLLAANINDIRIKNAINKLVINLKAANIWTKMKAIYPMVGGTATTHKFNLKNPLDTNAAFRLTFTGGWTHSATGALPNGTNAYANTYLATNILTNNSNHLGLYTRTNQSTNAVPVGSYNNTTGGDQLFQMNISTGTGFYFYNGNLATELSSAIANSKGFFLGTTRSSTDRKIFRNATSLNSLTTPANTLYNSLNNYLGARNFNGSSSNYSTQELAFSSIGDGLTDAEALAFYNAVNAFQVSLARNV